MFFHPNDWISYLYIIQCFLDCGCFFVFFFSSIIAKSPLNRSFGNKHPTFLMKPEYAEEFFSKGLFVCSFHPGKTHLSSIAEHLCPNHPYTPIAMMKPKVYILGRILRQLQGSLLLVTSCDLY